MKKILIVTDFFLPHKSGITTYVENLAKILNDNNFKITVLTSDYNGKLKKYEKVQGIKILRSKVSVNFNRGFYSFDLIRKFIKESKRADYVNIHYPLTEIFPLIFLTNKPIYLNYHCLPSSNSILLIFIKFYFYFFGIISIFLSKKVIVFTKDYFYSFYFHKFFIKKIFEILPYIEKVSKLQRGKKSNTLNKKIKIGFLGRISEEKGLEDLIKASFIMINKNINHSIKIAGDLKDPRFKKYTNDLLKLKDDNKFINFIGRLEEYEKKDFFDSIDLLVLPSTNSFEAFGLVQLEAMSFGIPVIASDLHGVRIPILYTGNGLLYKKGNVGDLVKCIISFKKWLKNNSKSNIINSYQKHFNKNKFTRKYLSLFN